LNEGFYTEKAGDLSATMKESKDQLEEYQGNELQIITGAFKIGKVPE